MELQVYILGAGDRKYEGCHLCDSHARVVRLVDDANIRSIPRDYKTQPVPGGWELLNEGPGKPDSGSLPIPHLERPA